MRLTANEKRRELRRLLQQSQAAIAPSVGDALGALLVQAAGLPAVHCSGSVLHNLAGYADGGLLTMTEMVAAITAIADAVDLPLIADADTGFGHAANLARAVRQYERSGAAAMHIEDQLTPTRPAMAPAFRIGTIGRQAMVDKIKAAVDVRVDADFMVVARCDVKGDRQEVLERLAACLEAGADAAWLPPGTLDEMRAARATLPQPLIGVMPAALTVQQFCEVANCALLPGSMQVAAVHAQRLLLESLKRSGGVQEYFEGLSGVEEARQFYAGIGMSWLRDMDSRYPA
jgi:2-methylisocitrate lyase-like PEP mutase family enzyme